MNKLTAWSSAFFSAMKPMPRLTISEWAAKYRVIGKSTSPEAGLWKNERTPYLVDIMDAVAARATEIVVCCMSSQVGKTELLLNITGYYAHQEPSQIMMVQPTVEMAEAINKERVDPMFKESPVLARLLDYGKDGDHGASRKSSNTIRMKYFSGGGYLVSVGGNAPAGLASRPIRIALCDEIDRYPDTTSEGDTIKLVYQRTTNFWNRKLILTSTPTYAETSKIYDWFMRSDQRYYHVPCPDCGHEFVFKWELMKWSKDEHGNHIPETAHIECPACSFRVEDRHKKDMLAAGKWQATSNSKIKGFHISSLYSPWVKFSKLVTEWLEVTKSNDKAGLLEFMNLKLGEPYFDNSNEVDDGHVKRRREFYNCELPERVLCITCGVDVQDDRLALQFVGWGEGSESWVLEYREMMGDPAGEDVWRRCDEQLMRSFAFADGRRLGLTAACVDSGGHNTQAVYEFVQSREQRLIFAIKGAGGQGLPIVGNHTRNNRLKVALFRIGVDTAKELLYQRLKIDFEGAGYIHFPREADRGCDDEYFKMLLSEKHVLKFERGVKKWEWKKVYRRNESLDTFVYALTAFEMNRPNFEILKQQIAALKPDQMPQQLVAQPAPRGRRVLSKGVQM